MSELSRCDLGNRLHAFDPRNLKYILLINVHDDNLADVSSLFFAFDAFANHTLLRCTVRSMLFTLLDILLGNNCFVVAVAFEVYTSN